MKEQIVNNSISTDVFSRSYPYVNKYLMENGDSLDSRYGHTREILNFKTEVRNPYARLVGNNKRDINVFFLLAEAIWIFKGGRDVNFLTKFNSRMSEFSDDGKVFHAPYGFRLRHYGVSSYANMKPTSPENNSHAVEQNMKGEDQILTALKMLDEESGNRRTVMSIWNTELDLNTKSKDIPCNDLVMLKVRKGELHTTIANRSNDLHWGLPTNIFQFSFITEIMSNILDLRLGTQVHNSQSLHFYTDNPIASNMYENMQLSTDRGFEDLYDRFVPAKMDMSFISKDVEGKLKEVDYHLGNIMDALTKGERMDPSINKELLSFSKYLHLVYDLLRIYSEYKVLTNKSDELRFSKFKEIDELRFSKFKEINEITAYYPNLDILGMAGNFFASRIKDEKIKEQIVEPLGNL